MNSGSDGSSPASSNPTLTSYAEMRPSLEKKKRSDRPGESRSADLVDVGLEGSGKEGRGHGGDLLEASGRVTGRRLGESSWGSGRLPFGEPASCSFGFSELLNYEENLFVVFFWLPRWFIQAVDCTMVVLDARKVVWWCSRGLSTQASCERGDTPLV
jgi:hypothetical protein